MTLCLDIGNSFAKCAVVDGERVTSHERIPTSEIGRLGDVVRRLIGDGTDVPAIVSSVVPDATDLAVAAIEREIGAVPVVVSHRMLFPFDVSVARPEILGTDRLCAAAGAMRARRQNAIVVDVGSAITIDVVDHGKFLGGLILTGPKLALRALGDHTGKLPHIDFDTIPDPLPTFFDTTESAMTIGSVLGSVGGIREAVQYLSGRCGRSPRRVLTGGQAATLAQFFPAGWEYDHDLVLKGLARIAALNTPAVADSE